MVAVSRAVSDLAVSETPCVDHAVCGTPPHAVAPHFLPTQSVPTLRAHQSPRQPEPTPAPRNPEQAARPHLLRANQPTISESGHLPRPSVSNHISAPRPEPESVGFFGTHGRCSLEHFFCERQKRVTAAKAQPQGGTRQKRTSNKRRQPATRERGGQEVIPADSYICKKTTTLQLAAERDKTTPSSNTTSTTIETPATTTRRRSPS